MDITYWNAHEETLDKDALRELQLIRLRQTVGQALKTDFYKRRLNKVGISSGDDIKLLTISAEFPLPLRMTCGSISFCHAGNRSARCHSFAHLKRYNRHPTVIYHSRSDIDNWTDLMARCIISTGVNRGDVFQNMTTYGLFTGGLGFHYGAERIGILVIPASSGNQPSNYAHA